MNDEGEDAFYKRFTRKLELAKEFGVTEHGRVSHTELADAMLGAHVWAYPTEFKEINCITALKANASGLTPIITDVAALKETGGPEATYIETDTLYSDEYSKQKFVKEVVKALKEKPDPARIKRQREWVEQFTWDKIAGQWKDAIK